jgi:hypothetical protein
LNEDEPRAKQGQRCPKVAFRVLCLLTNGVLDIMFNLDAEVVNNVQDDKVTFNGNKGNLETLDEGTCNRPNYANLGIKRCP